MYTEFYGFREKPFNLVPDPSFLYLSSKHRMALTHLEYGLMEGIGFVLLTGEIGTGKTTIISKLLSQCGNDIEVAVIFNTNVSAEQLLELTIEEFGLEPPKRGKVGYLGTLNQFLISRYGQGRRVVLIVDEAQNLSQEALEEIRMISNLQSDKDSLLQIVLVGQPRLRVRLRHPSLAQLYQRIAVSYHLTSLSFDETKEYIAYRLGKAGGKNDQLFTAEAMKYIFRHSEGIPRTINMLCDAALLYGYADSLSTIDEKVIRQVVKDRWQMWTSTNSSDGKETWRLPEEAREQEGGSLQLRLRSLEEPVDSRSGMLDWHIHEQERLARGFQDKLIQTLESRFAEERKRNEELLTKSSILEHKLSVTNSALKKAKKQQLRKEAPTGIRQDKHDADVSGSPKLRLTVPTLKKVENKQFKEVSSATGGSEIDASFADKFRVKLTLPTKNLKQSVMKRLLGKSQPEQTPESTQKFSMALAKMEAEQAKRAAQSLKKKS